MISNELTDRLRVALDQSGAMSCLLYGSQARGDADKASDIEVAFVFESKPPDGTRAFLGDLIGDSKVRAYSLTLEGLRRGRPDVPFQTAFFSEELRLTGITLFGQDTLRDIPTQKLTIQDCREELAFTKARMLDSIMARREGAIGLCRELAFKAVFSAVRLHAYLDSRTLICNRDELTQWATAHGSPEANELIGWAWNLRRSSQDAGAGELYRGMSYMTQDLEGLLQAADDKNSFEPN